MSVNLTEQRPLAARPVAEAVFLAPVPALARVRRPAVEVESGVVGGSGVAVNILAFDALLQGPAGAAA
ncbi:hypothetical protein ACU639_14385 [Streptomyces cynarae]|uniref:hypothetical protein n=1 Tax=Streptomyces cynarae TaxID=2981134 RepID=UPI00406D2E32